MSGYFNDLIKTSKARREVDAKRFEEVRSGEICQLCFAEGADKRSLFIQCGYAVHEVVPEAIDLFGVPDDALKGRGYYLLLCKSCRGRLLGALGEWRKACVALRSKPKDHDGYLSDDEPEGAYIPVRINGVVKHLTEEEWEAYKEERNRERKILP